MNKSTADSLLITYRGHLNRFGRYQIFSHQNRRIENISEFKDNLDIIVSNLKNIKSISFSNFDMDDQNELFCYVISNLAIKTNENSQYAKIKTLNLTIGVMYPQITMLKENVIIAIYHESSYRIFRISKIYFKLRKLFSPKIGNFILVDINFSTLKLYLDKVEELDASDYDFSKFEAY